MRKRRGECSVAAGRKSWRRWKGLETPDGGEDGGDGEGDHWRRDLRGPPLQTGDDDDAGGDDDDDGDPCSCQSPAAAGGLGGAQ